MSRTLTKVVHLSSVHRVDDIRVFHKECRSLAKAGYPVTLIARGEVDSEIDGVRRRALKSSSNNRLVRLVFFPWRVLGMALRENAVIYHFHDPELIPIAAILKTLGKRVIYDVHEDVPADIRNKDWIPRPLRPVVSRVAALSIAVAARWLDGIVTATPHIASLFRSHEPIVVQNFPMAEEALADSFRHEPGRLVYAGMLIEMRGAREMVRAMEIVGPLGARLTIVGTITPSCLQSELETMLGWRYIDFVGWQDRESLARTVSMASVGLVLFHPGPNHLESQPNKLFEYMLAGLAVVGSDFPHWRQFVERTGAGLLVDPQDPNAIAEAIAWLLEHPAETEEMGKCGRRAVLDKYSWEREADNLLSFYDRLSGLPSRTE